MEALYMQPFEEKVLILTERGQEKSGAQEEDEETDEDSESETPLVIRRKVSFADAFGLNLVSVKEFDNVEATESEVSPAPEIEATHSSEEFYMSCLFTVPSCSEELEQRLQTHMVELESIELLPGTSTLRGTVRVVNLCYNKSVYTRMTLDRWRSYFDLLAEYIPGSSDRKTDRFTFRYTLIPPFEKEGARVEFCLRYETSKGTFWANNNKMNYVLFCHQRGHVMEQGPQVQEESSSYRSKRSCLKANRRGSTQEKALETSYTSTVTAEGEATHKAQGADMKTKDKAEIKSVLNFKEHKSLVDGIKSRHRAARLARVQDRLAQRRQQVPKAYSYDSAKGQELSQSWVDSASLCQKRQSDQCLQVLTYHQIPLMTLDWNNDKIQQWGSPNMDDIWTERAKVTFLKAAAENIEDKPCDRDMWKTLRDGTDDTANEGSSVGNVWQAFLTGTSCADHSGVPESEWLQSATSVSPSNDKKPGASGSQKHEIPVETNPPEARSGAHHQSSDCHQTSPAFFTLNTEDHQPLTSLGDSNMEIHDAAQRSKPNSITDTSQELSLIGARPVSKGSVDSPAEREGTIVSPSNYKEPEALSSQKHEFQVGKDPPALQNFHTPVEHQPPSDPCQTSMASVAFNTDDHQPAGACLSSLRDRQDASQRSLTNWVADSPQEFSPKGARPAFKGSVDSPTECHNQERDGIIGRADGTGRSVPIYEHTADFVTSSGESETTDMTETLQSENASADDRILQGARLDLSREVTDTAHNVMHDTLAFQGTIKQGTKDTERFILPVLIQEEKKGIMSNCTANRISAQEEVFRPQKTDGCEISLRCADEKREFRLSQNSGNPLLENERLGLDRTCEGNFKEGQIKLTESERKEVVKKTEVETSCCTSGKTTKLMCEDVGIMKVLNDESCQCNMNSLLQGSVISEDHKTQSRPIQAKEDLCNQKNVGLKCKSGEYAFVSSHKEEETSLSSHDITEEQQEIHISAWTRCTEQGDVTKAVQPDRNTQSTYQIDTPNALEVVEIKLNHLQSNKKDQTEDIGDEKRTEVTTKETLAKTSNSTELQHQPELLEIIEEDMSQRDKDERRSIGKLKIEAQGELMVNVETPQGEESVPDGLEEQELSAEVESSPHVECEKLLGGTKETNSAESSRGFEVMELEMEDMLVKRFGEDLVKRIWEDVFGQKAQACNVSNDDFDSGVFSLIEVPTDQNLSVCQGLEETFSTRSRGNSLDETNQLQTQYFFKDSQAQTDWNLSDHFSQDPSSILAAENCWSLTGLAQISPDDHDNYTQIKERSVACKETVRQTEDYESFYQPAHLSHSVQSSPTEKLKDSDHLVWWNMFYIIFHITRLIVCVILVIGFFLIVFLYDFPTFFALYIFSMWCWFSQWRKQRLTAKKEMVR